MRTGKCHMALSPVNKGTWKHISVSFGMDLIYQLRSMCWWAVYKRYQCAWETVKHRFLQASGIDLCEHIQITMRYISYSTMLMSLNAFIVIERFSAFLKRRCYLYLWYFTMVDSLYIFLRISKVSIGVSNKCWQNVKLQHCTRKAIFLTSWRKGK